jgi:hypothetical protein
MSADDAALGGSGRRDDTTCHRSPSDRAGRETESARDRGVDRHPHHHEGGPKRQHRAQPHSQRDGHMSGGAARRGRQPPAAACADMRGECRGHERRESGAARRTRKRRSKRRSMSGQRRTIADRSARPFWPLPRRDRPAPSTRRSPSASVSRPHLSPAPPARVRSSPSRRISRGRRRALAVARGGGTGPGREHKLARACPSGANPRAGLQAIDPTATASESTLEIGLPPAIGCR